MRNVTLKKKLKSFWFTKSYESIRIRIDKHVNLIGMFHFVKKNFISVTFLIIKLKHVEFETTKATEPCIITQITSNFV